MAIRPFPARKLWAAAVVLSFLTFVPGVTLGQNQPPAVPPPDQPLSANQLDDLVAPIALYPDPLVSQVLVASTYPLEVVQAAQWLQRNPGLRGPALTKAAQEQNWDASVQALVMFPDALRHLNEDINWTTSLGNAFLAQQQEVMEAIQRMRARAQQNGKLASSPQQTVITEPQNGPPAIEIMPVNPNVLYVPVYDPVWIWGPPVWYPYPLWYWPPTTVIFPGLGFGFGAGINVGFFFGVGWHGWGGWGWHPIWGGHTIVVNNTFIHQNNFNTARLASVHGTSTWVHDSFHRQGVPYSRAALNEQYRGAVRQNLAPRPSVQETQRALQVQSERFGNRQVPRSMPAARSGSVFGGQENGRAAQVHSEHGYSSMGAARSAPAPRPAGGSGAARGGGKR